MVDFPLRDNPVCFTVPGFHVNDRFEARDSETLSSARPVIFNSDLYILKTPCRFFAELSEDLEIKLHSTKGEHRKL